MCHFHCFLYTFEAVSYQISHVALCCPVAYSAKTPSKEYFLISLLFFLNYVTYFHTAALPDFEVGAKKYLRYLRQKKNVTALNDKCVLVYLCVHAGGSEGNSECQKQRGQTDGSAWEDQTEKPLRQADHCILVLFLQFSNIKQNKDL